VAYSLGNLYKLIQSISPENIKSVTVQKQKTSDWVLEAAAQKQAIREHLMEDTFGIRKEKALELCIAIYQSSLIELADTLAGYQKQVSKKDKMAAVYQDILFIVESMLTFIERHFTKYFNLDAKIPDSYLYVEQNEIKKKVTFLEAAFKKLNFDKTLLEILFLPLKEFTNERTKSIITFRKLIYLKELVYEIRALINDPDTVKTSTDLENLLLYLNFNNLFFFNYYIDKIRKQADETTSISERIEKVSWYIKEINQSHFRPGVSLYNDCPHIKDQLINWLSEDISHFERKHQLNLSVTIPAYEKEKTEPVYTSLSVPQLALFIKILIDTGVISNKNQTELLRTISKTIRTSRNEIISAESLRNKYYSSDKATTDFIKNVIIDLRNQVNKYA
jgi:hypothetical protein